LDERRICYACLFSAFILKRCGAVFSRMSVVSGNINFNINIHGPDCQSHSFEQGGRDQRAL